MKNLIKWLIVALSFVCLQIANGQIDPSLLSMKNRQIGTASQPVTIQSPPSVQTPVVAKSPTKLKVQHMVTSAEIIADTLGNSKAPDFLDKMDKAARDAWEKAFKTEKVQMDAFYISRDTVIYRYSQAPSVDAPAPTFAKSEITVRFENGQIVPISKLSDTQKKAIVDTLQKPQVVTVKQILQPFLEGDDLVDSIFNNSKSFTYFGETYSILSEKEATTQKPRVKKSKPIGQRFTITHVKINSNEEFIDEFEDAAIKGEIDGVPACITLAQGILESRGGRSLMAMKINNLFGIKCGGGRCNKTGCQHGYFDDDRSQETFRAYPNFEASFNDHVKFFTDNDRYDKCLSCGLNDISCWLYRLQKSGYATDEMYDYKLASIINRYKLTDKPIWYNRSLAKARLAKYLK